MWLDENLDFILAKSSISDEEVIDLNGGAYERSTLAQSRMPKHFRDNLGEQQKRNNAFNFLSGIVISLIVPASADASPEVLIDRATIGINRRFKHSRFVGPSEKLREKIIRDWLGIALHDCDLMLLLSDCEKARTGTEVS